MTGNINLNIAHFLKLFSYRASYSACTMLCKFHDFLISCFKPEHILQKMCLFGTFISSFFFEQDLLRKMTMTTCIKLSLSFNNV